MKILVNQVANLFIIIYQNFKSKLYAIFITECINARL